jgi:hypothetical protein
MKSGVLAITFEPEASTSSRSAARSSAAPSKMTARACAAAPDRVRTGEEELELLQLRCVEELEANVVSNASSKRGLLPKQPIGVGPIRENLAANTRGLSYNRGFGRLEMRLDQRRCPYELDGGKEPNHKQGGHREHVTLASA